MWKQSPGLQMEGASPITAKGHQAVLLRSDLECHVERYYSTAYNFSTFESEYKMRQFSSQG